MDKRRSRASILFVQKTLFGANQTETASHDD